MAQSHMAETRFLQKRFVVARPVKDAHHIDLIANDLIENLVIAMHAPADALRFEAWHKRMAQRHGGEAGAFVGPLFDEGARSGRIIPRDVVADRYQILPGL